MSNGSKEQELPEEKGTDQSGPCVVMVSDNPDARCLLENDHPCAHVFDLSDAIEVIATLTAQVEELQEEVQGRKDQVSDLSDAVFERDERITSLATQVEELSTQTAAGTSAIYVPKAQYDSKVARYEAELDALREGNIAAFADLKKIVDDAYGAWDSDQDVRAGKLLRALAGYLPGYRRDVDRLHLFILSSARERILDATGGEG